MTQAKTHAVTDPIPDFNKPVEGELFDGDKTRSCFKDHKEAYIETASQSS